MSNNKIKQVIRKFFLVEQLLGSAGHFEIFKILCDFSAHVINLIALSNK